MRSALALAAVYWLGTSAALAQTPLRQGDFVTVSADGATLVASNAAGAESAPRIALPAQTWFEAVRSSGSWTAGYAWLDGQRKAGWVLSASLTPRPAGEQSAIAAGWEKKGARIEQDARGEVLSIDASDSQIGDAELAQAVALPRLEELSLGGSRITGEGLTHLARLPLFKRLFLDGLPLADDALQPLAALRGLEGLSVAGTKVTDAGLAHLSGLANLQVLNLTDCQITDAGLMYLAPLTNVETLALKHTQINGAGLEHVRGMKWLNVLNLDGCPLDGVHLQHLHRMENLRILRIADCNVEKKDITELEQATISLAVFD